MPVPMEDVRNLLKKANKELIGKENVVATGVGFKKVNGQATDQLALICSVSSKKAKKFLTPRELIPSTIQNVPTDVHPTGVIHILQDPKRKFRPAPGGVSIGHVNITAGTLGCYVHKNGVDYVLSNNHVLANSNDANPGDSILQPGPADGGRFPEDRFAELTVFIKINFITDGGGGGGGNDCKIANGTAGFLNAIASILGSKTRLVSEKRNNVQAGDNKVDCALARPLDKDWVKNEILQVGAVAGIATGELGASVKKFGRTTEFTTGTIEQIDVTVNVSYGSNKVATFVDQLMTGGGMSAGGDSGSAVVNDQNEIVGLLFAGSSSNTILNRIQNVFTALDISLIT